MDEKEALLKRVPTHFICPKLLTKQFTTGDKSVLKLHELHSNCFREISKERPAASTPLPICLKRFILPKQAGLNASIKLMGRRGPKLQLESDR